jgi:hypothetical protein
LIANSHLMRSGRSRRIAASCRVSADATVFHDDGPSGSHVGRPYTCRALIDGVNLEVRRIEYVAVTRTKNLLWPGVPASALMESQPELLANGFQETSLSRKRTAIPS